MLIAAAQDKAYRELIEMKKRSILIKIAFKLIFRNKIFSPSITR